MIIDLDKVRIEENKNNVNRLGVEFQHYESINRY